MKSKSKKQKILFLSSVAALLLILCVASAFSGKRMVKNGSLKITFVNTANGKPVVLNDSSYTNAWGESYTISKLRYYISNISLGGSFSLDESDNYQLIDVAGNTSFTIPLKKGKYSDIHFLLGVDSIRNCSGAQSGALDPMNDMFWTWNSGYVIFKLEGISPSSSSNNNRIEHHVGGYRFGNNVSTPIRLRFNEISIKENETAEICIEMNMDKYWASANNIKIAEIPVCTLPGNLAKTIAANFTFLFSIKNKAD